MFTFEHHYFSFIFIFGAFVAVAVARAANICKFNFKIIEIKYIDLNCFKLFLNHVFFLDPLSFLLNLGRTQKIPVKVS